VFWLEVELLNDAPAQGHLVHTKRVSSEPMKCSHCPRAPLLSYDCVSELFDSKTVP